ncbi:MAG: hypothetical protein ACE5JG_07065, partial [Planctomycetota bacterium]
ELAGGVGAIFERKPGQGADSGGDEPSGDLRAGAGPLTGTDPYRDEGAPGDGDEAEDGETPAAPRIEPPTATEIFRTDPDPATFRIPMTPPDEWTDVASSLSFVDPEEPAPDPDATKTEASDQAGVHTFEALDATEVLRAPSPDESTATASIHDASTAAGPAAPAAARAGTDEDLTDTDVFTDDTFAGAGQLPSASEHLPRQLEFEPYEPPEPAPAEERRAVVPTLTRRERLRRRPTRVGRLVDRLLQPLHGLWAWTRESGRAGWEAVKGVHWDRPVAWWRSHPRERRVGEPGWWKRTLTEVGVAYLILLPLELILNGRVGAYGAHPHPYWLIVIPVAAARGAGAALLAAAIGSLLYVLGAVGTLGFSGLDKLLHLRTLLEPLLFFGAGFVIGDFRDVAEARYRRTRRSREEGEEWAERLRKERDVLAEANRLLEKRLVDQTTQFGNLVVAAKRMESADRTEIFELALDMVEEHCGATGSVLLVLDSGSVDFLCYRGWTEAEVGERLGHARRSALVRRALQEGTNVNGFAPGEAPPERGPIAVGPLFDREGVVRALLCLDDVPTYRLNHSTLSTFFGIAEWISAALARVERGVEPPDPRQAFSLAPEADAWMGEAADLGERLRLEYERLARYGIPTSLLTIQATEWADTSAGGRKKLDRYVLCHFTGGLRASDTLYRFGYPGCYVLLLAGTNQEGAEVVRKRLERRVLYRPSPVVGKVAIEVMAPDAEAPDLVSLAGRIAGRFRQFSALTLDSDSPVPVPAAPKLGGLEDFIRRIKVETSLALRNGLDLHVIGLFAEGEDRGDAELFGRHVQDVAAEILRHTDGVYRINADRCAVLLPATDATQADVIARRIVEGLKARDPDAPYGEARTSVIGLGPSHPDPGAFLFALDEDAPAPAGGAFEPPAPDVVQPEPAPFEQEREPAEKEEDET